MTHTPRANLEGEGSTQQSFCEEIRSPPQTPKGRQDTTCANSCPPGPPVTAVSPHGQPMEPFRPAEVLIAKVVVGDPKAPLISWDEGVNVQDQTIRVVFFPKHPPEQNGQSTSSVEKCLLSFGRLHGGFWGL